MNIIFKPLMQSHFALLLKWLEEPHVKKWWDPEIVWTPELIYTKYSSYVQGYKLENGERKKIDAYIICVDDVPIGYIQYYNAYDFARDIPVPTSLAAFDIFIGEQEYFGKGIGSKVLQLFLEKICSNGYAYVFAHPEKENVQAIKAYEKAGFKKIEGHSNTDNVWMLYQYLNHNMLKKIMIFGRPGSGKSTFAFALNKQTGIPLYHLDKHFYESNWVERNYQEFLAIQHNMVQQDCWIIDGNNTKSLEMRYAQADVVIYFNYPKIICFWRIYKRFFYKNRSIDDRAVGCKENIRWSLLKYMWGFEKRVQDSVSLLQKKYSHVRFYEIRSDGELKKLCIALEGQLVRKI